jgi:hypothetical protein
MPDETVIDRPPVGVGGGGTTRRGGGRLGTQGADAPPGTPAGDDFDRLAGMLEGIRDVLNSLIHLNPPIFPEPLQPRFVEVWPETENHFDNAIRGLRADTRPPEWRDLLENAGLTGTMLRMKETSLNYYLDKVNDGVRAYSKTPKLPKPKRHRILKKVLGWFGPTSTAANSVISSVPEVVFPAKDVVREVKEHVEAGVEAGKLIAEKRNT